MRKLSITTAWNETNAFVRREASLLLPIAFLLIAVPTAFFQLVRAAAGADPEPGPWMLVALPMAIITTIGSLAIAWLALRPGTSVSEALKMGARRVLPLLGAVLILMLAGIFIASLLLTLLSFAGEAGLVGATAFILLLFGAIWVRLVLMTSIAVAERAGPVAIIRRSWALTSGHFWHLLGFLLLIAILFIVVTVAISSVLGIFLSLAAGGRPQPGSLSSFIVLLIGAIINGVVAIYFTSMVARIYAQLSGEDVASVFEDQKSGI